MTYEGKTLYLQTNRGYYIIHPNSDIERTDMFQNPSDHWYMLGLTYTGRPSGFTPLDQISPEWLKENRDNLKKYAIVDCDHGTPRQWMNEHLINMWFFDSPQDTNYYKYSRKHLYEKVYRLY